MLKMLLRGTGGFGLRSSFSPSAGLGERTCRMNELIQVLQLAAGLVVCVGRLSRIEGLEKMCGGQVVAGRLHHMGARIVSGKRIGFLEDIIGRLCRGDFAFALPVITLSDRI